VLINYTLNIQIKEHSPKLNVVTPYGVINKPFSVGDNIFIMENTQEEIWKDIAGYEGLYQVSNLGRVMSFKKKSNSLLLSPSCSRGYLAVNLYINGNVKNPSIHRLVAIAFIPNPLNKPCVNHIDGNKLNNKLSNLEWCTYSENELHSIHVLGKKKSIGIKGEKNPLSKRVYQFSFNGIIINEFVSRQAAFKFVKSNINQDACIGAIANALTGISRHSYGSKWSYSPNFLDIDILHNKKKYKNKIA